LLAGFALFRLFDVWKPCPIRWFDQRVKGGMGVMIDDVIAGIFAAIVLGVLLHLMAERANGSVRLDGCLRPMAVLRFFDLNAAENGRSSGRLPARQQIPASVKRVGLA
jgi:hypothetical protein